MSFMQRISGRMACRAPAKHVAWKIDRREMTTPECTKQFTSGQQQQQQQQRWRRRPTHVLASVHYIVDSSQKLHLNTVIGVAVTGGWLVDVCGAVIVTSHYGNCSTSQSCCSAIGYSLTRGFSYDSPVNRLQFDFDSSSTQFRQHKVVFG